MDKELFVECATNGIEINIPEEMQSEFIQSLCGFLRIMELEVYIKEGDMWDHSDKQLEKFSKEIYIEHNFEEFAKLYFQDSKIKFLYTVEKEFCTKDQNKVFASFIMFTIEFATEYNKKIQELVSLQLKGYDQSILDAVKKLEPNNLLKNNNIKKDKDDHNDDDDDSDDELWL